ncbi:MAG: acetyl-CoA carboxylase biotin carboxyl carrier protein [Eubacteriaceae bacterium]
MELTLETIDALSQIMKRDQLTSLSLDQGHLKIELKREGTGLESQTPNLTPAVSQPVKNVTPVTEKKTAEKADVIATNTNLIDITSPMVGVFYESSQPGKPAFISTGQSFKEGDTLCIVEAMKLMNEITAEFSGKIVEICVNNEEVVEFGQVLFRVERG